MANGEIHIGRRQRPAPQAVVRRREHRASSLLGTCPVQNDAHARRVGAKPHAIDLELSAPARRAKHHICSCESDCDWLDACHSGDTEPRDDVPGLGKASLGDKEQHVRAPSFAGWHAAQKRHRVVDAKRQIVCPGACGVALQQVCTLRPGVAKLARARITTNGEALVEAEGGCDGLVHPIGQHKDRIARLDMFGGCAHNAVLG